MKEEDIKLISLDKARLEKIEEIYWIYYNTLKYKSNSTIQLSIDGCFENIKLKIGCQACTQASISKSEGNKHTLEITYDTKNIGNFTKTVTFFHTKNGKEEATTFKIIGTVSR